jgi:hypothetical protein
MEYVPVLNCYCKLVETFHNVSECKTDLTTFKQASFFEAAVAAAKIDSSIKLNHDKQI